MINKVYFKKNVALLNHKTQLGAIRKEVLCIEDDNGKIHTLDLVSMCDITENDKVEVKDTKRTKIKYLFNNERK